YKDGAKDQNVRSAFAITLSGIHQEAAAAAVLMGQGLPPLDDVEPEALPPNGDHWWEHLEVDEHPPCPLPPFLTSATLKPSDYSDNETGSKVNWGPRLPFAPRRGLPPGQS